MEVDETSMPDKAERELETPAYEIEEKIPRALIRLKSDDNNSQTSKPRYMVVHRRSESPCDNKNMKERKAEREGSVDLHPLVQHIRYDDHSAQSPKDEVLNNGLDPMGMDLISSTNLSMAGSEYSDKSDEHPGLTKMTREMKNLQKSTNESKILSDYLSSSNESPRRSRKSKEPPLPDPDEQFEVEEMEIEEEEDGEIDGDTMSPANDGGESDSTLVIAPTMEPPNKRRKSEPRSRSASQHRKKSMGRRLQDELSMTSDKDENHDDEDDDQSEISFITNRSLEGRAVNPPPKPGWDPFCFKCHTDTVVLSLACSKCKCSYHRQCVRPIPIPKNTDEFICPECIEVDLADESSVNKYGHDKIDSNTLADMLTIILEKIRTYPDRELFENEILVKGSKEPTQTLVITQMSLKILETRIKTRQYTTTESFIHDVKQLEHNWNIVDRSKSKTLKSIVKYVNTEINELEACVFCYEKSFITGEWFIQPCKRLHLLIWAKLKGYPYWPAKVMSIDTRQQVDVRFFGAHDRAWVPAAHCILFCEQDPNKTKGTAPTNNKSTSKTQKGIVDAMKEKDDYIKNLREKFGFKFFKFRETFDPNDHQKHLEFMLPGLKSNSKERRESQFVMEKEIIEGAQKEKLTLKIIKGQSSNYQVEQKQTEKVKPKLYKVLSKTDENADMEQPGKLSLIIKRKSNVEQDAERPKRNKINDNASETSESNASVQSGKQNYSRRKSQAAPQKHKKAAKNSEKEKEQVPDQPPPVKKSSKQIEKQKLEDEEKLLDEVAKRKLPRRSRAKSSLAEADKPLLVPAMVPSGTDEIASLREFSTSPSPVKIVKAMKRRSRSLIRSRSIEKEADAVIVEEEKHEKNVTTKKRSLSDASRKNSRHESLPKPTVIEKPVAQASFDPYLVIKDEPLSDNEEVVEPDVFTLSDIPDLMQDKSGKKKLIVISTNDGKEPSTSQQVSVSRAKKSFPNKIPESITSQQQQQQQIQQQQLLQQTNRNGNWMICIPPPSQQSNNVSPTASSRSTPASEPQFSMVQVRSNPNSARSTPSVPSNRNVNVTVVQPVTLNNMRRSSQHSSQMMNGQHSNVVMNHQQDMPRLMPRPQGVFLNDGSNYAADTGPVSRMLIDQSHRMTEFFKKVLVDTVTSFSSDVPEAENLMLRSENEKLKKEMITTKSDCQFKMHELRKEHQDEIDSLKRSYEDRMINLQAAFDQDKNRAINEVRKQCENEKQRAIEITRRETKKTTWCSNCTKEARFYCCWNTSYCGQQCQKTHWQHHQKYCTNKNSVNEAQAQQQQLPPKQQQLSNESSLTIVPAQSTSANRSLPYRSPHNVQVQQAPSGSALIPSLLAPVIAANQQMIIAQQSRIMYPEKGLRENQPSTHMPHNLIIQTIHRTNEPNISVITSLQSNESSIQQQPPKLITTTSQS